MLVSRTGSSLIWPFLLIFVSNKLDLALTVASSLMSIRAVAALVASFIAGSLVDRFGRKWSMVISLVFMGVSYFLFQTAETFLGFALLMAFRGLVQPLYQVGANAMVADLIPEEERIDAYALVRLSGNVGIALGPALGGFIISYSYDIAFTTAAAVLIITGLAFAFLIRETLQNHQTDQADSKQAQGSFLKVFADKPYMTFSLGFTLIQMCATLVWVLLALYATDNFGITEQQFGWIPTTNAIMVVTLQLFITKWSKQRRPLQMMALGAFLYALGVGSVALGSGFWAFWLSMVVMTFGELVSVPTATTIAANLAPPDLRGRYMSIYSLTWGVASGIAPVFGGFLNDSFGPQYIWVGGLAIGLVAALNYLWMQRTVKITT